MTAKVSQWSETKPPSLQEVKELILNCDSIDTLKNKLEEKVEEFCYWDVFAPYFQNENQ